MQMALVVHTKTMMLTLQNFHFKSETRYTVVIMKGNLQNFKFEPLGPFFMKVGDPRKGR